MAAPDLDIITSLTALFGAGGGMSIWKMFQRQSEQIEQLKNHDQRLRETKEKTDRHSQYLHEIRLASARAETTLTAFGETLTEVRKDVKEIARKTGT